MKILLIDDSPTSVLLFKANMPEDIECEIISAHKVASAVEAATEQDPDLIIFDYNMPEMNGLDLAESLLKKEVKAPFVLCTANVQQSVIDKAKAINFKSVIEKPVNEKKISQLFEDLKLWN